MKIASTLLFLLHLLPFLAGAQSNYKPGFVVTQEGDTIHGFINYREWAESPASITFREEANGGTEKEYDVQNARYFEIKGMDAYRRFEATISMTPVATDKLKTRSEQAKQVTGFAKVLYHGLLVDFLSYTDHVKTRYFYQEKEASQPQELFFGRYLTSANKVVVQKGYIGQLLSLADKHDATSTPLQKTINAAAYRESDLLPIFSRINTGTTITAATEEEKSSRYRFFAGAALNSSKVSITGITGLQDPDENPVSYAPLLSVGYDFFLNRYVQKLFFRAEGGITAGKHHVQNKAGDWINYYSYKIAHQSAFISPQFLYNFYRKKHLQLYAGVHGQLNLSRYTENLYSITVPFSQYDPTLSDKTNHYPEFRKTNTAWVSYGLRSGLCLNNRFELYGRYNFKSSITEYLDSSLQFSSFSLGLNYLFIN